MNIFVRFLAWALLLASTEAFPNSASSCGPGKSALTQGSHDPARYGPYMQGGGDLSTSGFEFYLDGKKLTAGRTTTITAGYEYEVEIRATQDYFKGCLMRVDGDMDTRAAFEVIDKSNSQVPIACTNYEYVGGIGHTNAKPKYSLKASLQIDKPGNANLDVSVVVKTIFSILQNEWYSSRFPLKVTTSSVNGAPQGDTGGNSACSRCSSLCFSGNSTVDVLNQGPTPLSQILIGDKVLVDGGKYEPVYSFVHHAPKKEGNYLRITTDKGPTLDISKDHMLFENQRGAIPASMLSVGDQLVGRNENLVVEKIQEVTAQGVFAPLTPSGKILVDGVLSSSYVVLERASSLNIFGIDVTYQWMSHAFFFPHRLRCHYLSTCANEDYTEDGIAAWLIPFTSAAQWALSQSYRDFIMVPFGMVLVMFYFAELLLTSAALTIVGAAALFLVGRSRAIRKSL